MSQAVSIQGRNYAKKRLNLILNCVAKLLKCEIELEVDGTNPNTCRSSGGGHADLPAHEASLQAITLLVQGRKEMVERFLGARADEKVVVLGAYRAAGNLELTSVEVTSAPAPLPSGAPSD